MSTHPRQFATTRWSMILAAAEYDAASARPALAELCELYWPPLYSYLRRAGCDSHEAADCLQSFFSRLLENNDLASVDPAKGRFRSFLLASLKHFLANQRRNERALKRGGGRKPIPIDAALAEAHFANASRAPQHPDEAFVREWAIGLLDRVRKQLAEEQTAAGRGSRYRNLEPHLTGDGNESYAAVASELGMSENGVKVAVHRLRKRFKELLRAEINQTVASDAEIDEEIGELFRALSN